MIRANEVLEWQNLPGYLIRSVPAYSLQTVCAPHPFIDLVDIDVQGAEYEVLAGSFKTVSFKIGVIHIGTHSEEIEQALKTLLSDRGWLKAFDYPCHRVVGTRFGEVTFVDGVQTWVNPDRLNSRRARRRLTATTNTRCNFAPGSARLSGAW